MSRELCSRCGVRKAQCTRPACPWAEPSDDQLDALVGNPHFVTDPRAYGRACIAAWQEQQSKLLPEEAA